MVDPASLELLLDHAQNKVVLLDEDGRFTYVNAASERLLGVEPGELVGENAFEYVHPDDVAMVRDAFERVIAATEVVEETVEYRHRTADESWVWLESRMSNLSGSELDGYVVSSRDVTDRVEAERERQRTAARLQELATTASDVLWIFDGDWSEVLFVNPAYEEIYGKPTDELERNPASFLDAIHPDDVPAVREAMARLSAGTAVDVEYRVNPGKNYKRWVWVQAEPIVVDGEVVRITGFSRDVTDRRRRERQLYVMDNLLRHNLRNDLNLIMGTVERIEEAAPELSEETALIRRTGEELLTSARKEREIIEFLTGSTAPERIDLVARVEAGAETVRDRFPAATIDLSLPAEAQVYALQKVGTVVEELLENSVLHSRDDHPTVSVSVRTEAASVTVVFEDDCPPIPDAEAAVLTGDHDMSEVYHSSGLGFWLAYWVVDLSDGDISLTRGETAGNRITVTLPRDAGV